MPKITHIGALCASLLVSGCGGGGGGGLSSSASGLSLSAVNPLARQTLAGIGQSTPRDSSVSQTTNVDGSNVTRDSIHVTVSGANTSNLRYVLTYDATSDGTAEDTIDTNSLSSGQVYRETQVASGLTLQAAAIGLVGFDSNGNGANDGRIVVAVYTDYDGAGDTDYLAGGAWLYVPNSGAGSGHILGAFADGPSETSAADVAAATGSATYSGRANAIYTAISGGQLIDGGELGADASFTANFNTNTISGTVSNIVGAAAISGSLTLGSASIDTSVAGGFFTGDLSGTVDGIGVSGKWGGKFFDKAGSTNAPGAVAGTIGGNGNSGGTDISFSGAFGAYKQ